MEPPLHPEVPFGLRQARGSRRVGLRWSGGGVPIVGEVLVAAAHNAGGGGGADGVEVGYGGRGAGGKVGEAAGGVTDVDNGRPPPRQGEHEGVLGAAGERGMTA